MGNIKLILNISRIDLVIALSVFVIAVIAIVGLIAWFIKTSRQNKTLYAINSKLEEKPLPVEEKVDKEKNTEPLPEENIVMADNCEEKEVKLEKELEGEADVLEEIRDMLVKCEQGEENKPLGKQNNLGKSGKVYTKEELEKIITD